jgi:hypothetical protein
MYFAVFSSSLKHYVLIDRKTETNSETPHERPFQDSVGALPFSFKRLKLSYNLRRANGLHFQSDLKSFMKIKEVTEVKLLKMLFKTINF